MNGNNVAGPLGCAFADDNNYVARRVFELADEEVKANKRAEEACDEQSTRDAFSNKISSFEDETEVWIRASADLSETDKREQLIELKQLAQEMREAPEQYSWL